MLRQWGRNDIPKNVSMSHVDKTNYATLQKAIRDICGDIPSTIFDLYAWEEGHRKLPAKKARTSFVLIKLKGK